VLRWDKLFGIDEFRMGVVVTSVSRGKRISAQEATVMLKEAALKKEVSICARNLDGGYSKKPRNPTQVKHESKQIAPFI